MVVTPVKIGVQNSCNHMKRLDSGFRRNDRVIIVVVRLKWSNQGSSIYYYGMTRYIRACIRCKKQGRTTNIL